MSTWILLETDAHPKDLKGKVGDTLPCFLVGANGEEVAARISVLATERKYVAEALLEETPIGRLWEAAQGYPLADVPREWQSTATGELFDALQNLALQQSDWPDLTEQFLADLGKQNAEEEPAEEDTLTGHLFEGVPE
jgi:hypothetical protein